MAFSGKFPDHVRAEVVERFARLVASGIGLTKSAIQAGEPYGVSRQRVREWATEDGVEVTPTPAKVSELSGENRLLWDHVTELESELSRLRREREAMKSQSDKRS